VGGHDYGKHVLAVTGRAAEIPHLGPAETAYWKFDRAPQLDFDTQFLNEQ
jgi:hypothetical protein